MAALTGRIIVGGPPNSGKSTFSESLARALRQLGIDAYAEDLDLASPTLEFIRGAKGWTQRQGSKKEWTPQLSERAAAMFEEASTKHTVVIGDAPRRITAESEKIARKADYAIILCREDRKEEIMAWQRFFQQLEIAIICIIISKTVGRGNIGNNAIIKATVVGLNRTPKADRVITRLALLIKERLGI